MVSAAGAGEDAKQDDGGFTFDDLMNEKQEVSLHPLAVTMDGLLILWCARMSKT